MLPEERELLERSVILAEENNKMLRKVRSVQKWAAVWRTLKFLMILGIALGSFYFLEPYFERVFNLFNSLSGMEQKLNSENTAFQDFMKKFSN